MWRWTSWVLLLGSLVTVLWSEKEPIQQTLKDLSGTHTRPFYCENFHSIPGYDSVYADWVEWNKLVETGNVSSGPLIVLFYLPTCTFSRSLWPKVEGLSRAFPEACVITIRPSWETLRLGNHVVYAFPTLFISKDGRHFHRYRGERNWEDLLNATQVLLEKKARQTSLNPSITLPRELFSVKPYLEYAKHLSIFAIWLGAVLLKWPPVWTRTRQYPNNNPWDQYLL